MPREIGLFPDFFSFRYGNPCPKCSSILDAILKEEGAKNSCNLGALIFNPDCGVCQFFREVARTITGDNKDARTEAWSWNVPTNFQLMANTKGHSVEADSGIGYFWIHHYHPNTPKPDHFSRYLDAHVRICRVKMLTKLQNTSSFVKNIQIRYPQSSNGF